MGCATKFVGEFELKPSLTHEQWIEMESIYDANPFAFVREGAPNGYCQWVSNYRGTALKHDDGEKFYDYEEWLRWLLEKRLKPWGVIAAGKVTWLGEEAGDTGVLEIVDGKVTATKIDLTEVELSDK